MLRSASRLFAAKRVAAFTPMVKLNATKTQLNSGIY